MARERQILRSESRWLQKALFALSKAEDEHAKLVDLRAEDATSFDVSIDGTSYPVHEVTAALKEAVNERLEQRRASRRVRETLAR